MHLQVRPDNQSHVIKNGTLRNAFQKNVQNDIRYGTLTTRDPRRLDIAGRSCLTLVLDTPRTTLVARNANKCTSCQTDSFTPDSEFTVYIVLTSFIPVLKFAWTDNSFFLHFAFFLTRWIYVGKLQKIFFFNVFQIMDPLQLHHNL